MDMTLQAPPSSPVLRRRRPMLSEGAQYRWAVASRALAAIGGGYVLSAVCSTAMALWLPLARAEAVLTGTMASFLVYTGAVMWVFAARTAWHAWAGVAVPSALLGAALWLAQRSGGAA